MNKLECLQGCLARVFASITFVGPKRADGGNLWTVNAVRSGQSSEAYASTVGLGAAPAGGPACLGSNPAPWLQPEMSEDLAAAFAAGEGFWGSFLRWGPNDPAWVVGDGSAAVLEIAENGDLLLRQKDYGHGNGAAWSGSVEPQRVCGLANIVRMEFRTTSGWGGECYPERVYYEEDLYREDDWLVVLHRSTGAVTIERKFPF